MFSLDFWIYLSNRMTIFSIIIENQINWSNDFNERKESLFFWKSQRNYFILCLNVWFGFGFYTKIYYEFQWALLKSISLLNIIYIPCYCTQSPIDFVVYRPKWIPKLKLKYISWLFSLNSSGSHCSGL